LRGGTGKWLEEMSWSDADEGKCKNRLPRGWRWRTHSGFFAAGKFLPKLREQMIFFHVKANNPLSDFSIKLI
jgi:hypothetical protein